MSRHLGRVWKKLERIQTLENPSEETEDDETLEIESIYYKAKEEMENFVDEMTASWEKVFNVLKIGAENSFKFWHDFGSPWDLQSVSLSELQESTVQQLASRAAKIELTHNELRIKLNGEIEKLREEEIRNKLEKKFVQVMAIVDKKSAK